MKKQEESNQGNRLGKNLNYKEGERELTITVGKSGDGYPTGKMNIPYQWFKELNLEPKQKNVIAKCENGEIIIRKNNN
ncbi:MAG: AbrB/MazE/SpoVT family DNA-binding domain-containing protein [Clostridia bacterium]|nr:AbrB/MazE/SpoVT family DNA-binding domain-containing protein [Clostridia bacterium]